MINIPLGTCYPSHENKTNPIKGKTKKNSQLNKYQGIKLGRKCNKAFKTKNKKKKRMRVKFNIKIN